MLKPCRITLFAGHYGSGKTNLAVNYALFVKQQQKEVAIVDLDIVNPYFRSKDSEQLLREKGILFISSAYANSNVDVPSFPAQANMVFDNPALYSVVDVGGDDRGAYALGRYAAKLRAEQSAQMLLVINCYRPLTSEPDGAYTIMREIEQAAGVPFAGIVNNSNLGNETKPQHILDSLRYADEISQKTKLPLLFTSVRRDLLEPLEGRVENLFPIEIMHKSKWNV